jgi:hypothetical protein
MSGPDRDRPIVPEAALERCIEEASFTFCDGTPWLYSIGVGGGMCFLHRYAAAWYARRYLVEHGRLPEGRQHVQVRAYAHDHETWGGIKNVYGGEREVRVWVTFPRKVRS